MTRRFPHRHDLIAMDRAGSVRSLDQDGHLRVSDAVFTGVGVNEYLGSEIPNAAALGLNPNQLYALLRPADELQRAAAGLAGKPLLMGHTPLDSANHPSDAVVGAVGSAVRFDGQYVRGSLSVWVASAIQDIQNGRVKDLSAGYYYVPDFSAPGTFQGQRYVATMRDVIFNHLSLVPDGRFEAAFVGDARPRFTSSSRLNPQTGLLAMDNDDPDIMTQICTFLADKISPDDLSKVQRMLAELVGAPVSAADAPANGTSGPPYAGQRAAGMDGRRKAASSYAARFPNANRLAIG
jgi:Uncharacterized protein conserved in bacteria (DUF2213)